MVALVQRCSRRVGVYYPPNGHQAGDLLTITFCGTLTSPCSWTGIGRSRGKGSARGWRGTWSTSASQAAPTSGNGFSGRRFELWAKVSHLAICMMGGIRSKDSNINVRRSDTTCGFRDCFEQRTVGEKCRLERCGVRRQRSTARGLGGFWFGTNLTLCAGTISQLPVRYYISYQSARLVPT